MLKLIYAILVGIVGAALLHLIIILSIPHYSNRDAYSSALQLNAANNFRILGRVAHHAKLTNGDPFMKVAICTFELGMNPIRLTGFGVIPFWSVSVFDDASNELFSMNERTSVKGQLDVVIANSAQLATMRKVQPAELSQSISVLANRPTGYAVLRAFMPQPSFNLEAERFLDAANCQPFRLPQS